LTNIWANPLAVSRFSGFATIVGILVQFEASQEWPHGTAAPPKGRIALCPVSKSRGRDQQRDEHEGESRDADAPMLIVFSGRWYPPSLQ
jgi:hypothetical protein